MKLTRHKRSAGEVPWGALVMLPLFALPLGGWLVEQGHLNFGTCAMKAGLGIPCLSCGATRATLHLLHGELPQAIAMQPLMVLVYALIAIWGLISLWLFARNRHVSIVMNRREDHIFKASLIIVPLLNWAYLIAAGI